MSICVIVPSRNRPDAVAALAAQFALTATRADTSMVIALDDDDPKLDEYEALALEFESNVRIVVGPRARMGPTLNREAVAVAPFYDIVAFMGDDHRPRTVGWDTVMHQVLDESPGVAYGNDLIQGANLPTAVFMTASLVEKLGYMAPPGLIHLYLDNFWVDLGRETNLTYRDDVIIEHMHPIAGRAEWDEGYLECNSGAVQDHDAGEYRRFIRDDWPTERIRLGT